jgi:hypothetical protein
MFNDNENASLVKKQSPLAELASPELNAIAGGMMPSDPEPKSPKQEGPIWMEWIPTRKK